MSQVILWAFSGIGAVAAAVFILAGLAALVDVLREERHLARLEVGRAYLRSRLTGEARWYAEDAATMKLIINLANETHVDVARETWRRDRIAALVPKEHTQPRKEPDMVFAVEAWAIHRPDDEEPADNDVQDSAEFSDAEQAKQWAWDRMEEGFDVRMYRRDAAPKETSRMVPCEGMGRPVCSTCGEDTDLDGVCRNKVPAPK